MTEERIEYVDHDYVHCAYVNPSRQIKTRKESFGRIANKFTQFRLRLLEKMLDRKVEKALTQGYPENKADKKIAKNAEIIARLEEKIMKLSKKNVPVNYVARRAIKLRKSMAANLTYNATSFYGNLYSVGIENREAVMGSGIEPMEGETPEVKVEEDVVKPVIEPVKEVKKQDEIHPYVESEPVLAAAIPAGKDTGEIDVVDGNLDRQAIVDTVNAVFDGTKEQAESVDKAPTIISTDEVREVIDGSLEEVKEDSEDAPVIDKEVVRQAVNEAFRRLEAEQQEAPVIRPVIESTVEEKVDSELERIRVSRNNAGPVHSAQYDAEGQRVPRHRRYDYTPMTDEEIRQSQIKLGFDEHGNLIDNGKRVQPETVSRASVVGEIVPPTLEEVFEPAIPKKPIREVPLVVPTRDEASVELGLEDGQSMFEIVTHDEEPAKKDVSPVVTTEGTSSMTIDDFTALREKILLLQQKEEASQQQRLEAQKRAEEAEARAQEAKRLYEVSQANYNERMQMLRAYAERLEAACSENERQIADAERRSQERDDFVQAQRQQADRTNQIISEIDSMMNDHPEGTVALAVRSVK